MKQIKRLVAIWVSEIRLNRYENYTDINRIGEHTSRQLLNKIYGYELEDLNKVRVNFPGLDIGDQKKAMLAFQVTSRTDSRKIIETLQIVVENNFQKTFVNGVKFLILNDTEVVNFGPKTKKLPVDILSSFKLAEDVLYPIDLIKKIEQIYEDDADLIKFNEIKQLLEKEFIPVASGQPSTPGNDTWQKLQSVLSEAVERITTGGRGDLKVSRDFFYGDLKVPAVPAAAERGSLVSFLSEQLKQKDALWVQGAPSTGKTSLAMLLSRHTDSLTLWIECRDIKKEQLIENIIISLSKYFKTGIEPFFEDTLISILSKIATNSLVILNDVPDLQNSKLTQQQLGRFITASSLRGVDILVTSNFHLGANVGFIDELDILEQVMPPFDEKDTQDVMLSAGASAENIELLSGIITTSTQGHPLLIQSAVKFLNGRDWSVDKPTLASIFTGNFDGQVEREIYSRVLEHTTEPVTRSLLYRLSHVLGSFDDETILGISQISPSIDNADERINQLKGVWLQENGGADYLLSPLIRRLKDNVPEDTKHEIYKLLGNKIIEKKNISQTEAFTAIYYFSSAQQFNNAAIVLIKALMQFVSNPQLFYDWGFNLYWYETPIPEKVLSIFKVQIRVFQIDICVHLNKNYSFLLTDLEHEIQQNDVGALGRIMVNLLFFQLNLKEKPLSALQNLSNIQSESEKVSEINTGEENIIHPYLLNGVWLVFAQIHKRNDYEHWFALVQTMHLANSIVSPDTNELYAMASVSIYRNAVLKNQEAGENIAALLYFIINTALVQGLFLLAAYGLKYLVKYFADLKEWDLIQDLPEKYEDVLKSEPLLRFLFIAQICGSYFYAGNYTASNYYMGEVGEYKPPKLYTEYFDYLIVKMQLVYKKDTKLAAMVAMDGLELIQDDPRYSIEDKCIMHGEAAIGEINTNEYENALRTFSTGYSLLLDNFSDTEGLKAAVIRYGNAIKYNVELLESGEAASFGENKFVIPEPGFFYRTNEKLFEGGYYFDERKFMVAILLQGGFEELGDIENAKYWAYKAIELSLDLNEPRFVPILQNTFFYLIIDKQYRQAYNVQAHLDKFYRNVIQKIEAGEPLDNALKGIMANFKMNDLGIYLFIIIPAVFSISLDIVKGQMKEDEYQLIINEAFSNERYVIKDTYSFSFLKTLFERILIDKVSFTQMLDLLGSYTGEFRDMFSVAGYLLLSSLTTATEAANLQLGIILSLNKIFKASKNVYKFLVVPYFEIFWRQKLHSFPQEFSGKDHLRAKGFALIEKASIPDKIATIFRVISDHLKVTMTSETRDFIEGD